MICCRPLTNSARLRQRLSIVYARDTRWGSREFQLFSAPRTLRIAVSRVKGGTNFTGAGADEFAPPCSAAEALNARKVLGSPEKPLSMYVLLVRVCSVPRPSPRTKRMLASLQTVHEYFGEESGHKRRCRTSSESS